MDATPSPWETGILRTWAIVGMNHYHMQGEKRLFVAMTKGTTCIVAEGPQEETVWDQLRQKAKEAEQNNPTAKLSEAWNLVSELLVGMPIADKRWKKASQWLNSNRHHQKPIPRLPNQS